MNARRGLTVIARRRAPKFVARTCITVPLPNRPAEVLAVKFVQKAGCADHGAPIKRSARRCRMSSGLTSDTALGQPMTQKLNALSKAFC